MGRGGVRRNACTLIIRFVFKQGDKSIFFPTSQQFSEKVGFVFQLCKTWSRGLRASEATEQKWIAKMILKDLKAWFKGLPAQHGFNCVKVVGCCGSMWGKGRGSKLIQIVQVLALKEFGGC